MSQDGNYGFAFYRDQVGDVGRTVRRLADHAGSETQNYHGMPGDAYGNGAQQHIPHRASDPLDLLQFHRNAPAANELSMSNLTKPVNDTAWNPQLRALPPQPHSSRPIWIGSGIAKTQAMTEPMPEPELYRLSPHKSSEVSDSAYESMPTSGGALEATYNNDSNEFMGGYFAADGKPNLAGPPAKANSTLSVKSEGQFFTPSANSRRKQHVGPCRYPGCKKQPKNQSDAKKHELTHTKPYRCHEPDCNRKDGFATVNDLERHKKSVHEMCPKVGNPAGYICAACPIVEGVQPKFWPRRDNFKAHIKRKHASCHEEQLLEASKQNARPDDTQTADGLSVYDAALRSARHSQVDPIESHAYQQASPFMAHPMPECHDGPVFPPDSAIESQGDPIAFAGGHMDDTQILFGDQHYGMPSPMQLNGTTLPFPSPAQQHSTPRHGDFAHPEQRQHMLPSIQVTTSSLSEPQSASTTSTSQSAGPAPSTQGHFPCKDCGKIKPRECDLRKHMKRHTRPYGCTFPSCTKKFGSRNDWKRHESSQHLLTEMWKCPYCLRRPFLHQHQLSEHLFSLHALSTSQEIQNICERSRLGREGHHHFWCGFCTRLVKQGQNGGNAWDARFKHIGDHFDKDGRDSGDWVCVEENRMNRYIAGGSRGGVKRGTAKREEEWDLWEGVNEGVCDGAFWDGERKRRKVEILDGDVDMDAQGESDHEVY